MLSSPRSLGFVLAAIVGAMLVPGCRPSSQLSSSATREPSLQAKVSDVSGR